MKLVILAIIGLIAQSGSAAPVTPMVSGNGFGFAVASLSENALTKFYVHPYKFSAPNPANPFGDGFLTENVIERLGWPNDPKPLAYEYLEDTHVIRARAELNTYFYYMPFGLERPAVMLYRPNAHGACLRAQWVQPLRSSQIVRGGGLRALEVALTDLETRVLVVPIEQRTARFAPDCDSGSDGWLVVGLEPNVKAEQVLGEVANWRGHRNSSQLLARELREFENWRVPQPKGLTVGEMKLWRQSETVLRMAQSREPNRPGRYNHGLIVAALPDGGWFSPWVRDMSYALFALIRMGHREESRWGIEAFFNARPIGRVKDMVRGYDYQVPVVRYFGDGSEETNFSGEGAPNVEFDNWGNVLTGLSEYVVRFHDRKILLQASARGPIFTVARDLIARPLLGNLEASGRGLIVTKDTSLWEADAGSEQHFAYSTAAAIQGLNGFATLAHLEGDTELERDTREQVERLLAGFASAFVQGGFVHGTMEDNSVYNIDSGALEAYNFGAVRDTVARATLAAVEKLRMPSGGFKRIQGPRQYDKQEFLFSDFNWARNHLRMRERSLADALIAPIVTKSLGDHGFIPEMFVSEINDEYPGAIGAPAGSVPMVGYGAGMFVLYIEERARF